MALIVKMMHNEPVADEDTRKSHTLWSNVTYVSFDRRFDEVDLKLQIGSGEIEVYPCLGNVYVMNENGKTISSFGVAEIPENQE